MPSPLAALVQGYTEGQELHIKKAEKIAKEQSTKFEQQFKIGESQRKAAYEKQQQQLEAARVTIEKGQLEERTRKDKADEKHKEALEQLQQAGIKLKYDLDAAKGDREKYGLVFKEYSKLRDSLIVAGKLSAMEADNVTRYSLGGQVENIVGPDGGYPLQQGGQQPPGGLQGAPALPGGQQPMTDQSLQQHQLGHLLGQYSVKPNAEVPESALHATPGAQAALEKAAQDIKASKALEEQRLAKAAQVQALTQADLEYRKAATANQKARTDLEIKKAQNAIAMDKSKIGLYNAETEAQLALAASRRKEIDFRQQDENRKDSEFKLKSKDTFDKASKEVSAQLRQWSNEKTALQKQQEKNNEAWAHNEAILQQGFLDAQVAGGKLTREDAIVAKHKAEGLKVAMAQSLAETAKQQANAEAQYNYYAKLAADNRIRTVTAPSGKAAPKEQRSNERTIERDLHRSEQRSHTLQRTTRPVPVNPLAPGTHLRPIRPSASDLRKKYGL